MLLQSLNVSAAVIVTTPQRLSFTDVVKGVDMFDTVRQPIMRDRRYLKTMLPRGYRVYGGFRTARR
jgi:hypothetical protein